MQLHELRAKTQGVAKKRVGRGGKRGKTSGKGHKGQKARAGGKPRPAVRDLIKKIPKQRGYGKNRGKTVNASRVPAVPINLSRINALSLEVINPATLLEAGIVKRRSGMLPTVKLLASGEISRKVTVEGVAVSDAAREKIEKAGGQVK